jgi:uncharacterized protein
MIAVAVLVVLFASTPQDRMPLASDPVTDLADVIPAEMEAQLTTGLQHARAEGIADVRVLTVTSLAGRPIEEFALRVAEQSKIGSVERDDGVLLLIAVQERELRIETGRGIEATLTDADCFAITRKILRPRLRNEEYGQGVLEAVQAILATLHGETVVFPEVATSAAGHDDGFWSSLRLHSIPLWSVLTAVGALILAITLKGKGIFEAMRYTLLGVALLAMPIGHTFGSELWLERLAFGCFCLAGLSWLLSSPRTHAFRAPTGPLLKWMFKRKWAMPLAHVFAFPMWLIRVAGRSKVNYLYWIDLRWYGHEIRYPEYGRRIGWWSVFAGLTLEVTASGVNGLAILIAFVVVTLPLFGLARGVTALITGLLEGTINLQSTGSSSSSGSRHRDVTYGSDSSSSSSSESSSSGGSFDGGGASDSW